MHAHTCLKSFNIVALSRVTHIHCKRKVKEKNSPLILTVTVNSFVSFQF